MPPVEPEGDYATGLLECGPPAFVWCVECDQNTTHGEFCDEHGSNHVLACTVCRRIASHI